MKGLFSAIKSIIILSAPALTIGLWLPGTPMQKAVAQDEYPTVLCYDRDRAIVQRVLRDQCAGEIVSEEEADRIRLKARRDRMERFGNLNKLSPAPKGRARHGMRFGTAFPIDDKGHYLTARHVIENCLSLALNDAQGNSFTAQELARHEEADMALLLARGTGKKAVFIATTLPSPGAPLFTIGYPEQGLPRIRPARLDGTMQTLSKQDIPARYIAFKAGVRSGNSGGPLFNADGALVGMVIAKANTVAIFELSGTVVRDIGFAIAYSTLSRFLTENGLSFQNDIKTPPDVTTDDLEQSVLRVVCTS